MKGGGNVWIRRPVICRRGGPGFHQPADLLEVAAGVVVIGLEQDRGLKLLGRLGHPVQTRQQHAVIIPQDRVVGPDPQCRDVDRFGLVEPLEVAVYHRQSHRRFDVGRVEFQGPAVHVLGLVVVAVAGLEVRKIAQQVR